MKDLFVGIDPSLTGSAIVIVDQKGEVVDQQLIVSHKECYISSEQRVYDVFQQMIYVLDILHLHTICIEGLAFMSSSPTLFERCTLLYMLLIEFYKHDLSYKVIPPNTLKKFVADYGHADKELMMLKVKEKWGYDFKDDNIADAYGLARMAMEEK